MEVLEKAKELLKEKHKEDENVSNDGACSNVFMSGPNTNRVKDQCDEPGSAAAAVAKMPSASSASASKASPTEAARTPNEDVAHTSGGSGEIDSSFGDDDGELGVMVDDFLEDIIDQQGVQQEGRTMQPSITDAPATSGASAVDTFRNSAEYASIIQKKVADLTIEEWNLLKIHFEPTASLPATTTNVSSSNGDFDPGYDCNSDDDTSHQVQVSIASNAWAKRQERALLKTNQDLVAKVAKELLKKGSHTIADLTNGENKFTSSLSQMRIIKMDKLKNYKLSSKPKYSDVHPLDEKLTEMIQSKQQVDMVINDPPYCETSASHDTLNCDMSNSTPLIAFNKSFGIDYPYQTENIVYFFIDLMQKSKSILRDGGFVLIKSMDNDNSTQSSLISQFGRLIGICIDCCILYCFVLTLFICGPA